MEICIKQTAKKGSWCWDDSLRWLVVNGGHFDQTYPPKVEKTFAFEKVPFARSRIVFFCQLFSAKMLKICRDVFSTPTWIGSNSRGKFWMGNIQLGKINWWFFRMTARLISTSVAEQQRPWCDSCSVATIVTYRSVWDLSWFVTAEGSDWELFLSTFWGRFWRGKGSGESSSLFWVRWCNYD